MTRQYDTPRDLDDEQIDAQVRTNLFGEPVEPVRIGRYRILGRQGRGGMGVVYSAYDEELDRKVAIKLVRSTVDEATRERAYREAKALAKLTHGNVVAVYDVGTHGKEVWIAMEFVAGQTLAAWAAEKRRHWREVLRVMTEVARGVAAAHAAGLVHRDLKPDNVMIGHDGHARVLDFGLAYLRVLPTVETERELPDLEHTPRTPDRTQTGVIRGTPGYMAPEQWESGEVGAPADQFGWSVMAWEMLYGERPFAGVDELMAGRRRPSPLASDVPTWLRRVVERGLAATPGSRHADMTALIAALGADPTRRRQALVVGLCVLVAAGTYLEHVSAVAACAGEGAVIARSWGPEARSAIHAALVGTGASYAETTFAKIEPQLDEYADAWHDARVRLCMAATVERTFTAEQAEQAASCLDDARQQLESLLEVLSTPGPGLVGRSVVQRAVKAVSMLPRISVCEDTAHLSARPRLPEDDVSRREIRRIRGSLARAAALTATGSYQQGLVLTEEALADAAALGWGPLRAVAELQRGHLLALLSKDKDAEDALEEAYFTAGEVQADEVQTEASDVLTHLVGDSLARFDEGLRWGRTTRMLLERYRVPADDARWAIHFRRLGFVYGENGKYAESIAMHQRALEIHERLVGAEHPEVASDLSNLGNMYRLNDELDRALDVGRQALEIKERVLGPDHPGVADTLGNLGAIHLGRGDNERALELISQAMTVHGRALGPEHPTVATSLSNIAVIHTRMGARDLAMAANMRALAIREKTLGSRHPDLAITLHSIGIDLVEQRELDRGLEMTNRALEIWESALGPEHPHVGRALHTIGTIHGLRGDLERALEFLRRGLEIQEKALGPEHDDLVVPLVDLGLTLVERGVTEEARRILERGLRIAERHPGGPGTTGEVRFGLATAMWQIKGQRGRARALAREALDELIAGGPRYADNVTAVRTWLAGHADVAHGQ